MKKIFKLLMLIGLIALSFVFITNSTISTASSSTVNVTDDEGNVYYYKGSTEAIQRATTYSYPVQSLRATWVSQFIGSLPSYKSESQWKTEVAKMLDKCEEYGLNAIIYHVRTHNNAMYKSEYAPISIWMKNADFDTFDPIEYLIEETHKRGIEFHAWLNPYRVNDSMCAGEYPACNPVNDESNVLSNGSGKILDPGRPVVQDFLVNVCMELVEKYDVDAIHFDDYFYISGVDDSATRAIYNTNNLSTADFRRESVNKFIQKLSESVRKYNAENAKCVQIGISPPGGYQNGGYVTSPTYNSDGSLKNPTYSDTSCFTSYGDYLYADTLNWINHEWIDYIMPQTYWAIEHTSASYAALTRWWSWAVKYKKVNLYTGIGYYMADGTGSSAKYWQKNTNEIRDQLLNSQLYSEIGGVCFYSYNYLDSTNTVISTGMNLLKNDYYKVKTPADVKQYYAGVYAKPDVTGVTRTTSMISWKALENVRGYLVFKTAPGETLDTTTDKQIFYYGTSTSINITDATANYYISSVNLANEISEPKLISSFNADPKEIITYINSCPAKSDATYRNYVIQVKDVYDELTDAQKTQVTNANVLLEKYNALMAYEKYSSLVSSYVTVSLYSVENQKIILELMTNVKEEMYDAKTASDVEALYNSFTKTVDSYDVASVELKQIKLDELSKLETYYNAINKDFYTIENQSTLVDIYMDGQNKIRQSNSSKELATLYDTYVTRFNNVASRKEEYLKNKQSIISKLEELTLNEKDKEYYQFYEEKITTDYAKLLSELDSTDVAKVLDELDATSYNFETKYDDTLYSYSELYDQYISIENSLAYYNGNKDGLEELLISTKERLKEASTKEELQTIFDEFKTSYAELPRHQEEVIKSGCNSTSIIYLLSIFSLISLLGLVIKKH